MRIGDNLSQERNRYGLSRDVPEAIAREVRQRCGFGCVKCGAIIVEYHHFDPEFVNAREHLASGITLLCPTHHSEARTPKKGSAILPLEIVRALNSSPYCKKNGIPGGEFYFSNEPLVIEFGGMTCVGTVIPIMVDFIPVIEIQPPESGVGPFRLNAKFKDSKGKTTLEIVENIYSAHTGSWDVKQRANVITIREKERKICLQLLINAPRGMSIRRLDMAVAGYSIKVMGNRFHIAYGPYSVNVGKSGSINNHIGVLVYDRGSRTRFGVANDFAFSALKNRFLNPPDWPMDFPLTSIINGLNIEERRELKGALSKCFEQLRRSEHRTISAISKQIAEELVSAAMHSSIEKMLAQAIAEIDKSLRT